MKYYISGKITGLPEAEVRAKFDIAERQVRQLGHEPVSPLNDGLEYDADWKDHIGACIRMMLDCDAIYLLPDWKESNGARIEHAVACEIGLDIFLQENYIFDEL